MYERFYHLRERPFSLTPDPDYLYPSRVHQEALDYLRYGIEAHAGFVVITGEIGCGKTTLLQTVLRGLDKQTSVARIVNTMLDARELIEAIMLEFGLDPTPAHSKPMLLRDLARFLVDQRMARRLALLVVDEAQNLTPAALEEVRMLSNLETEKSKLIQVVLVGQPNLRDVLATPQLEQLRQRITVSYHLSPLGADETAAYVNHRLRRAALGTPLQFSPDVTALIHQHSQGVPRKINIIADAVLLFGYGEDRHVIDPDLTAQVLEELEATGVLAKPADAAPIVVAPVAAPARAGALAMDPSPVAVAATPSMQESVAAAIAARERDLAVREARVLEREQQLAEQRRVLVEGFDLTRTRREAAVAAARPAVDPTPSSWPPARPAPSQSTFAAATPMARTVAHATEERFWTKVRRSLFGSPKPVFEK
jgi:putative secretion ATPase (PEP-CTERM system associated)